MTAKDIAEKVMYFFGEDALVPAYLDANGYSNNPYAFGFTGHLGNKLVIMIIAKDRCDTWNITVEIGIGEESKTYTVCNKDGIVAAEEIEKYMLNEL